MTVNNDINVPLTGTTGTGTVYVLDTNGAITTPTLNGVTDGSNAASGSVGEFASSIKTFASPLTITSTITFDLVTLTLSAGNWDVWGNMTIAATTLLTVCNFWISSSSVTVPDLSLTNGISLLSVLKTWGEPAPRLSVNNSGSVTYYLSGQATFTGTGKAYGGIYARRRV